MIDPYANPEPAPVRAPMVQRLLGIASTVLLLTGLVAVIIGKDTASADPLKLLSAAPAAARDAGSARMTMTMSMKGQGISIDMSGKGLIDFASNAGSFAFSGFGATFEMLTDGATIWIKLPDAATVALPGSAGKWLAMPVTSAGGPQGGMFDPGQATGYLDTLRGAGGTVVDLGAEQVNGVDAHHYAVTVDLDKAFASMSAEERSKAEAGMSAIGVDGRLPLDVWLSDAGLPVRTTFDVGAAGIAAPITMHMQMDLTDFGVPVHITPPPADQVIDIADTNRLTQIVTGQAAPAA